MLDHEDRVVREKAALDLKISDLDLFIDKNPIFPKLPREERGRLARQLFVMRQYSDILGERIANFPRS